MNPSWLRRNMVHHRPLFNQICDGDAMPKKPTESVILIVITPNIVDTGKYEEKSSPEESRDNQDTFLREKVLTVEFG